MHNQVVARSARGDPAPIVPAKGQNQSLAFGNNKMITDITVAIVVKRISLYYVLGMIVPILLLAGLASAFEERGRGRRGLPFFFLFLAKKNERQTCSS